jgi:cytochrome c2
VAAPDASYTIGPNLWGVVGRPVASRPRLSVQ